MIKHKLVGNAMQMLVTELSPGEEVYGESGKFLWKSANVDMDTRFAGGDKHKGKGLFEQAIGTAIEVGKRKLAGESWAFVYFTPKEGNGLVSFAQMIPGEIKALELDGTQDLYVQKEGLLAAESTIDFNIALTKRIGAGVFGGQGFILEKFSDAGTLFIGSCGNFIELNPADYGGTIHVDTGCLVAFEETIDYDIKMIGGLDQKGIKNIIFGGEGIFFAKLTGNGKVWIQSMNITALARTILGYSGRASAEDRTDLGGLLGRI
ncbi:MAG: AIM24 family protein [Euryarchaeota archaeon]|nr:AIM24 family protein [Euryarchaeota archaeon]